MSNRLANPGFESGLTGWGPFVNGPGDAGSVVAASDVVRSGSGSCKITVKTQGTFVGVFQSFSFAGLGMQVGDEIELIAHYTTALRSNNPHAFGVKLDFWQDNTRAVLVQDYRNIFDASPPTGSTGFIPWTEMKAAGAVPAGWDYLEAVILFENVQTTVDMEAWVDDAYLGPPLIYPPGLIPTINFKSVFNP